MTAPHDPRNPFHAPLMPATRNVMRKPTRTKRRPNRSLRWYACVYLFAIWFGSREYALTWRSRNEFRLSTTCGGLLIVVPLSNSSTIRPVHDAWFDNPSYGWSVAVGWRYPLISYSMPEPARADYLETPGRLGRQLTFGLDLPWRVRLFPDKPLNGHARFCQAAYQPVEYCIPALAIQLPILPMLLASFAWAAVPSMIARLRDRHRRRHGCCVHCGYSLFGIRSGACPECGERTTPTG